MEKTLTALICLAVLCIVFAVGMGGCGVVRGIGEDVASMSRWTQDKLDNGFDKNGTARRNYEPRD